MIHQLAHEWFGNRVTPYEWSDLWLNEGHASWYEFLSAEENGQLVEDTTLWPDETGYPTLELLMEAIYAHGDQWRHDFGPPGRAIIGGRRSATVPSSSSSASGSAAIATAWCGRRLRSARLQGRATRPVGFPQRLDLRRDDAGDAGAPGPDRRSGGGGGDGARPCTRAGAPPLKIA